MIRHILVLPYAIALLLFVPPMACDKIELPSKEEGTGEKGQTGGGGNKPGDDQNPIISSDTINISDALIAETEQSVTVRGYIVGYVSGTNLSGAVFGCPEEGPNTNMLLADSPSEEDETRCLPVSLPKTSSLNLRQILNLYDNPENYGRPIAISGWLTTYFNVNGIKTIYEYTFLGAAGETHVTPPPTSGDNHTAPGIDHNPGHIPDGR